MFLHENLFCWRIHLQWLLQYSSQTSFWWCWPWRDRISRNMSPGWYDEHKSMRSLLKTTVSLISWDRQVIVDKSVSEMRGKWSNDYWILCLQLMCCSMALVHRLFPMTIASVSVPVSVYMNQTYDGSAAKKSAECDIQLFDYQLSLHTVCPKIKDRHQYWFDITALSKRLSINLRCSSLHSSTPQVIFHHHNWAFKTTFILRILKRSPPK